MKLVGVSHRGVGVGPGPGASGRCGHGRRGNGPRGTGGREAFTLLELLIVVAIMALVLAIIAPSALGIVEKARVINCGVRMHALATAHAAYGRSNRDQKPDFRRISNCWASPDTKAYCWPVGQGLLVLGKYIQFDQLLCPGWGMRADNANDLDMWQTKTYAGSSYLYRWWNGPEAIWVPPGDCRTTYTEQLNSGLMALVSDINLQGNPESFYGVFANRYTAHESIGLLNVLQVDGTVKEYDFNKTLVLYPGYQKQVLEFFNGLGEGP